MNLNNVRKAALVIGSLAAMAMPFTAQAVLTIEDVGATLGLGTADLKDTVLNIIRLVLGLLGLLAVIMVIYGGFLWMTAAGNEENVEKGKKVIAAAVVGLVVVLLAWAIVNFFYRTAVNVTEL